MQTITPKRQAPKCSQRLIWTSTCKVGVRVLFPSTWDYLYLLEFSIKDVKQNGRYHPLKVKVDRDGLTVQSRRGYFASKPTKKK